ncbi:ABC transporter permease [Cuniculiplasma sp. SKW4]|uniref:ABC transporter permease n=1 Tax=Cuniculiplasma sp. SKW4 TaxID=3400171 RepID=UPI003FD001DB
MVSRAILLKYTYLYYFRNYYRSRSFYLMFFLSLVISGLLIYLSFRYLGDVSLFGKRLGIVNSGSNENELLFGWLWGFLLSSLPVFASVFFGSPAISSEIENKTAFHIFTLPIPRVILLAGKYLASVSVTFIIVLTYSIIEIATFQYLFGRILIQMLYSVLLTLLFVLSISAVTFMISSVFNKNTYAYISVLITYLLVFYAATIIIELLYKTVPYYLLNQASSITYRVFIDLSFGITLTSPNPFPASFHSIISNSLIMFLYFLVSIGITVILFERKEVK